MNHLRDDFPFFYNNKDLIYFDNAATTQKPKIVIDSISEYYNTYNSNIHRSFHSASNKATQEYENVRSKVHSFINSSHAEEIIFTSGTTESINLIAEAFLRPTFKSNDEIIITQMEHHSNFLPWHRICKELNGKLRVIPIDNNGELNLSYLESLLSNNTKLISVTHVSNVTGIINPIDKIIKIAHKRNIPVLVDGAQSIPHIEIDVKKMDCDFFVFSAHKMYGPMGTGILYGKKIFLEKMHPYKIGGGTVKDINEDEIYYETIPYMFEAGTQNVPSVIGMGFAINYLHSINYLSLRNYEMELLKTATNILRNYENIKIIGDINLERKIPIISFIVEKFSSFDVSILLDTMSISVRSGNLCALPLMKTFNAERGVIRLSFSFYNLEEELHIFKKCMDKILKTVT